MYYFDEWMVYDRFPMIGRHHLSKGRKPKTKKKKVKARKRKEIALRDESIVSTTKKKE